VILALALLASAPTWAEVPAPGAAATRAGEESPVDRRLRAIAALEHVVVEHMEGGHLGTAAAPELMDTIVRLIDSYLGHAEHLIATEQERYQGVYDTCDKTKGCDIDELRTDNRAAYPWVRRGIDLSRFFIATFPKQADVPAVRSDIAKLIVLESALLAEDGRVEEAWLRRAEGMAEHHAVIVHFPESLEAAVAATELGLWHWDPKDEASGAEWWPGPEDLVTARRFLVRASATELEPRTAEVVLAARLETGRLFRRMDEPERCVDLLVSTWDEVAGNPAVGTAITDLSRGGVPLEDQVAELVLCWGDREAVDEAWAWLSARPDPVFARGMKVRFAAHLAENVRSPRAVDAYRRLVAESPESPDAAHLHATLLDLFIDASAFEDAVAELPALHSRVAAGSSWALAQGATQVEPLDPSSETVAVAGRAEAERVSRRLVGRLGEWLSDPQQRERARLVGLRLDAALAYLAAFPDTPEAQTIRYEAGDNFWEREQWPQAWALYQQAGEALLAAGEGEKGAKALGDAFLAAEAWVRSEKGEGARPPGFPSAAEQALIDSADVGARLLPGAKESAPRLLAAALVLFDREQWAEARQRLQRVLDIGPAEDVRRQAFVHLVDTWTRQEDWDGALEAVTRLRAHPEARGKAIVTLLGEVERDARIERIPAGVRAGRIAALDGAEQARSLSDESTFSSEQRLGLLLISAELFVLGQRHDRAAEARRTYVDRARPGVDDGETLRQLDMLFVHHESQLEVEQAALVSEERARRFPAEEKTALALLDAARMWDVAGKPDRAVRNLRAVLALPTKSRTAEEAWVAATSLRAKGPGSEVEWGQLLQDAGARELPLQLLAHVAKADAMAARGADPAPIRQAGLVLFDGAAPGLDQQAPLDLARIADLASELRYREMEAAFARFLGVIMRAQINPHAPREDFDAQVKVALALKAAPLGEVKAAHSALLSLAVPVWVARAHALLGDAHQQLSVDLTRLPRPDYLEGEQVQFYIWGLADQAFQQRILAVDAYRAALAVAEEAGTLDLWAWSDRTDHARRQLQALADLHPDAFDAGPQLPAEDLLPAQYLSREGSGPDLTEVK